MDINPIEYGLVKDTICVRIAQLVTNDAIQHDEVVLVLLIVLVVGNVIMM